MQQQDQYLYPIDWPKCHCGLPVLDGHLTCGRAVCGTQAEAQKTQAELDLAEAEKIIKDLLEFDDTEAIDKAKSFLDRNRELPK